MDSKSFLLGFLIGILLAGGVAGYLFLDRERLLDEIQYLENLYSDLENKHSILLDEKAILESQVSNLEINVETLTTEKAWLENEVTELESEVSVLKTEIRDLEYSYESLQVEYQDLSDYNDVLAHAYQLERELRIGNSLESYYDSLREGLGPTGVQYWWFTPLRQVWQTEVEFACNLAQHDLWRIYWPKYETEYEELTGENSYETAWNKLTTIITHVGISAYDDSIDKITKILSFLNENIHYEIEVNDIFLSPVETLGFKSGDCDDYSILTAALFEYVDVDSAVGFFKNDNDEYHAMVLVHLEDLDDYRYWYYDDLSDLGLADGQWIMIEPQTTITYQGDDEWMGQWTILVASELEG